MAVQDTIRDFYESLAHKTDAWQRDLSEDVVFSDASKKLHAEGREAFITIIHSFSASHRKRPYAAIDR